MKLQKMMSGFGVRCTTFRQYNSAVENLEAVLYSFGISVLGAQNSWLENFNVCGVLHACLCFQCSVLVGPYPEQLLRFLRMFT